jgi:ABC-type antimicrobial peptide transport system, permease component
MFNHFISITFRSFWRHKAFTAINIAGLAIGISASLVIYLIVQYEFSYEKCMKDGDRTYRVVTNMHFPNMDFKNGGVPGVLAGTMRREMPEIESSTQFWMANETKVTVPVNGENTKTFPKQDEIIYADEYYPSFIGYEWLAGNSSTALQGPNKVVLTESRAKLYFPTADPASIVGQTIIYDDSLQASVTGVVKDLDAVTGFTFKEFLSMPTVERLLNDRHGFLEWGNVNSASQFFVRLKAGTDVHKANATLKAVRKKHEKDAYLETDHYFQQLYDVHFNGDYGAINGERGHKPTLYGLLAVAAFLLVLGCINFINLTTAQATQRAKEIGIRKTIGCTKWQLVRKFMGETLLLTVIATLVSIGIAPWILKVFEDFIPQGLKFNLAAQPQLILFIVLLILVVSWLAGIYPALVLSRFRPVQVLKNNISSSSQTRRAYVRKTLTVAQFVIAQFFIIATLVVGKQIRFGLNKEMGFRKDAIVNFSIPNNTANPHVRKITLYEKLKAIPGIERLSLAGPPPASPGISSTTMKHVREGKEIETTVEIKYADTSYFQLYDIKFIAGRPLQQSDTIREYVVNESYARFLGYQNPADIVGTTVSRDRGAMPVVGVIKDIHTKSVHSAITPLVYASMKEMNSNFHVLLSPSGENTDGWKKTIASIEKAYKEIFPEAEFDYSFFDETIAKFYKKEQQTAGLLNWSAGLAIFISCLGLLGLVIFTTNQRTKEIGIRKVLGASVMQIVSLLSKDFMKLVALAFVIAAPLAWWAMNDWLQDFAYRTNISWWIFAVSGAAMLLAALLTLSIRTIRSASANPVGSLRNE